MAEGKVKITISIAGRSYPMTIDAANEELYRVAAKRLNEKITEYARIPKFDIQDRLAMAALRYSILALTTEQSAALGDDDVEELRAIEQMIRKYVKA
ncbi:MAG: cell division protein ZapA [Alistipes sp.]|nr:cell division protein ZapA [Alistipes sp.]MBR2867063.1 cell division protein ZapA [Alistipes sp.]MBR3827471.1 cell division protein ZapA [Alistipes sp.]